MTVIDKEMAECMSVNLPRLRKVKALFIGKKHSIQRVLPQVEIQSLNYERFAIFLSRWARWTRQVCRNPSSLWRYLGMTAQPKQLTIGETTFLWLCLSVITLSLLDMTGSFWISVGIYLPMSVCFQHFDWNFDRDPFSYF